MKQQFTQLNAEYPNIAGIMKVEKCIIDENDIPQGYGGINKEGYNYGILRRQPIIPELLNKINNPKVRTLAEDCNRRNSEHGFCMFKINGEYCFWGLRLLPVVKTPNVLELKILLEKDPSTAEAVTNKVVTPRMVRDITYNLLRQELAKVLGVSAKEAGHIIGNELDCAPHEDPCGYIFMVPNWAHNWFRHDGYVKQMLTVLNG
ncbi:hypothetical protein [Sphingobacterium sp.]|uniref:hypothetical protein n=1 Tax=Sphingobacterium sp. TaxID=341027 RepID=UPI002899B6DC|nr:hypothetical protein [Sphingobacterium sp.]